MAGPVRFPRMLGDTNSDPTVSRRLIRRGAKFNFEVAEVRSPGGKVLEREVVRHPGAVVVLPLLETPRGPRVVLIRNWRISLEQWLVELPAGTLEAGESPQIAAGRELAEETGYEAATVTPLGRFHTSPGMSDERMWAYVATGLTRGAQRLEADERVTVLDVPAAEALAMVRRGEIEDAKSMLTILWAASEGVLKA